MIYTSPIIQRKKGDPKWRVAVLVDTSTSWGRRIHQGIHSYAKSRTSLQLYVEARGQEEKMSVPHGWKGDGIIARVSTIQIAEDLASLRIPVVNVSGIGLQGVNFPRVSTDQDVAGRLAAEHFFQRGFKNFAYFNLKGLSYLAWLQTAFSLAVVERGYTCETYTVQPRMAAEPDWNLDLIKLGRWLKMLAKPVGILCWNPSSAREIIYACEMAGLDVPEDVAVLSASDDDLLCELLNVDISAIYPAAEMIGHEATRILSTMMNGGKSPEKQIVIPPLKVITRHSTDTLAVRDRAVVKAVSFIRENLSQPLRIENVARYACVSRRVLERRFQKYLNRTLSEEIRGARLRHAQELLSNTDLTLPDVAEASGFASPEYMCHVFREVLDQTPSQFRKKSLVWESLHKS